MDTLKIGKFIASKRKEKNMTQEDLANILGVTNKTVSRWENGNYMPDLSLLKPLSEALGVSLNELLSGKEIKEDYKDFADKNIENITDYFSVIRRKLFKNIYLLFMFFGLFIIISGIIVTDPESSWGAIYTCVGLWFFIFGFNRCLKNYKIIWQWILTIGISVLCVVILLFLDYMNVVFNNSVPRFRLSSTYTSEDVIEYNTLFYKVFRINHDTPNEYYIVDNSKKYNVFTVPKSPFNRSLSGIDNIIKYKNNYVGNNSNTGNLINSLPLANNGYVFEIDNTHLIINYDMTDWYYNDDLYVRKALIYNTVSLFSLIDNLESITFNFSGASYNAEKNNIVENYPNYIKVVENGKINKDNFNKYVEKCINDNEFVEENFNKIIQNNWCKRSTGKLE